MANKAVKNRQLKSNQLLVRAKAHLGEENEDGEIVHRNPGDEFVITEDRAEALGEGLLELVAYGPDEDAEKKEPPPIPPGS